MNLQVLIRAIAKQLRTARPEGGKPTNKLLGGRRSCFVEVEYCLGHCRRSFCEHGRLRMMQTTVHSETAEVKGGEQQNHAARSAK
jgi:hypothetical protein